MTCELCQNNKDGGCILDWGCCCIPDPETIEYLITLGEMFRDR